MLDTDHAKEPLAHCGRFGATYDAIARKLVDVLRDEGIYNRESDTVVAVATEALQAVSFTRSDLNGSVRINTFQSFNVFLDTSDHEPAAPLVLTKILASTFTIHGNHFAVLKHLHPNDAEQFHTDSIISIFRKVATYAKQERMAKSADVKARYAKKRAQCLTIFKCLILLLGPVNGRGALAIKTALGEGLKMAGVEPTPNKMWEAYRVYEKRLVLIASKDSNIRAGASRVIKEAEKGGQEDDADEEERTERSPSPTDGRGSAPEANQDEEEEAQSETAEDGIDLEADLNFDLELDQHDSASMLGSPSVAGRKRSSSVTTPGRPQPSKKSRK